MAWHVAPSLAAMGAELDARYPSRSKASDGTIGDVAHQARPASDHNPDAGGMVHARDITHDPKRGVDCHKLTAALVAREDPRVRYIIWDGRIVKGPGADSVQRGTARPWVWEPYRGINPHTKHMHVSVGYDPRSESSTAPWWPVAAATTMEDDMPLSKEERDWLRKLSTDTRVFTQKSIIESERRVNAKLAALRDAIAKAGTGTLDPADVVQAAYEGAVRALAEHDPDPDPEPEPGVVAEGGGAGQ